LFSGPALRGVFVFWTRAAGRFCFLDPRCGAFLFSGPALRGVSFL